MSPKIKINVLTLFPDFFSTPLKQSIIGRALKSGLVDIEVHNLREYATDKNKTVDDSPYGGGPGMVLKVDTLVAAVESIKKQNRNTKVVLLDPKGRKFNQNIAASFSKTKNILLVCGHYEGVDHRFFEHWSDDVISIGDYILSSGETASLVLIDAITRLIPNVLGNEDSGKIESFAKQEESEAKDKLILDYPSFTKPENFRGKRVPSILLSGDHKKILEWRKKESVELTRKQRPDLLTG